MIWSRTSGLLWSMKLDFVPFFRYTIAIISTNSEKISKFIKGLTIFYLLEIAQLVTSGGSF